MHCLFLYFTLSVFLSAFLLRICGFLLVLERLEAFDADGTEGEGAECRQDYCGSGFRNGRCRSARAHRDDCAGRIVGVGIDSDSQISKTTVGLADIDPAVLFLSTIITVVERERDIRIRDRGKSNPVISSEFDFIAIIPC